MDALGDQVHVGGGETAHGDTTVAQQVDVLLLHQELAHVRVQASEREHANLRRKIRSSYFLKQVRSWYWSCDRKMNKIHKSTLALWGVCFPCKGDPLHSCPLLRVGCRS